MLTCWVGCELFWKRSRLRFFSSFSLRLCASEPERPDAAGPCLRGSGALFGGWMAHRARRCWSGAKLLSGFAPSACLRPLSAGRRTNPENQPLLLVPETFSDFLGVLDKKQVVVGRQGKRREEENWGRFFKKREAGGEAARLGVERRGGGGRGGPRPRLRAAAVGSLT